MDKLRREPQQNLDGYKISSLLKEGASQVSKSKMVSEAMGKIPSIHRPQTNHAKSHVHKRTRNNKYGYLKASNTLGDRSAIIHRKVFRNKNLETPLAGGNENNYTDSKLKAVTSMNHSYDDGKHRPRYFLI